MQTGVRLIRYREPLNLDKEEYKQHAIHESYCTVMGNKLKKLQQSNNIVKSDGVHRHDEEDTEVIHRSSLHMLRTRPRSWCSI